MKNINRGQRLIRYKQPKKEQIQKCIEEINKKDPFLAYAYIEASMTISELFGVKKQLNRIKNPTLREIINKKAIEHKIRLKELQTALNKNKLEVFLGRHEYFELIFYIQEFKERDIELLKDGITVASALNKIIEKESHLYNKIPIPKTIIKIDRGMPMLIEKIEKLYKELEYLKQTTMNYKIPYMTLMTLVLTLISGILIEPNIINTTTLIRSLNFGLIILPIGITTDILMHIICKNNEKEIAQLEGKIQKLNQEIQTLNNLTHINMKIEKTYEPQGPIQPIIQLEDNTKNTEIETIEEAPKYDIHFDISYKSKGQVTLEKGKLLEKLRELKRQLCHLENESKQPKIMVYRNKK